MGEALISRLISLEIFAAEAIAVGDPSAARRQFLRETYGIQAQDDNTDRKSTRLNSSHSQQSRMPSSA